MTKPHYFVVIPGHIAFFSQYEPALNFKRDFNGSIFAIWGLTYGTAPDTSDIPETEEEWFRNAKLIPLKTKGLSFQKFFTGKNHTP